MTMPRPLVESIVATIALLQYPSDTEIEPRVATRGLEDIGSSLAALTPAEQHEFLVMCVEVAADYEGVARHEIPGMVADSLGLALP